MAGRTETFSGWLTKVKSDSAKARWFSGSNKRYFTVNFETQTFYYHGTSKKVATPIEFFDIMHAEQLPPNSSEGRRSLRSTSKDEKDYGFIVRTRDREIRLFSASWKESRQWVDALNAAGKIGRSQKTHFSNGGLKVENSQSQASLSTNEGSGSGSSPPSDDGSDSGVKPWQPTGTWKRPTIGGYSVSHPYPDQHSAQAPWKPVPAGAPPAWAQVGQPHTGDSLPSWASGSKGNAELEAAGGVDAFAALDALADELGPVPEGDIRPKRVHKAPKGTCKTVRDIAALKNPKVAAAAVPSVAPVAPSALAALPSLAAIPAFFQEGEDNGASTPSKHQFSSALGALPGPQQFTISDSPEKDDDAHSWDEDGPDEENDVRPGSQGSAAAVIAYAVEARGEGAIEDDDPWDSEPDEPSTRSRQRGPSEGQEVDHDSWDSEDEGETKVMKNIKTGKEGTNMQDFDDLVGEVLDGQK